MGGLRGRAHGDAAEFHAIPARAALPRRRLSPAGRIFDGRPVRRPIAGQYAMVCSCPSSCRRPLLAAALSHTRPACLIFCCSPTPTVFPRRSTA
ncbi:hypothetical protein [Lysobacter gummosus]|uniref:hypothetical protein n=1 Tax=Lysobacter gummosus TaxID=262324 RepID=UPI00362B88E5